MPITMKCPGCKTAFDFENSLEGKRIKCKSCGDIFRVEKPSKKARDRMTIAPCRLGLRGKSRTTTMILNPPGDAWRRTTDQCLELAESMMTMMSVPFPEVGAMKTRKMMTIRRERRKSARC